MKQIWVLKKLGYRIKVICRNLHPTLWAIMPREDVIPFDGFNYLWGAIKQTKADIFHCHTEPFGAAVMAKRKGKKVIIDVHDSDIPRGEKPNREEKLGLDAADAGVYVSEPYRDLVKEAYDINHDSIVLYSMTSRDFYKTYRQPTKKGLVYEGMAFMPEYGPRFRYCDFRRIFRQLIDRGIPVHAYFSDNKNAELYPHVVHHGTVDYQFLPSALSRFEGGLCFFNLADSEHIRAAQPNKVFDYMAACIPMIGNRGTFFGGFIENTGIGVAVDEIDQVCFSDLLNMRKTVEEVREAWALEEHIHKLIELYEGL